VSRSFRSFSSRKISKRLGGDMNPNATETEKMLRLDELKDKIECAQRARNHLSNAYGDGIVAELFEAGDRDRLLRLEESAKRIIYDLCTEYDELHREIYGVRESD